MYMNLILLYDYSIPQEVQQRMRAKLMMALQAPMQKNLMSGMMSSISRMRNNSITHSIEENLPKYPNESTPWIGQFFSSEEETYTVCNEYAKFQVFGVSRIK